MACRNREVHENCDATGSWNRTKYQYDAAGMRLWKQGPDGVTHVYYNGLDSKPLADFYLSSGSVQGGAPMVYFAGKRVDNQSVEDRLGTAVVEGGSAMAYFPYGELRSGTSAELQFATYKRDSTTNLDYAHHRYFSTQIVRFTTPDPSGTASVEDPQTFNQYSYAGDPVNANDPTGLYPLLFTLDGIVPIVRESGGAGGGGGGIISLTNWQYTCWGWSDDPSCGYVSVTSYSFSSAPSLSQKPGTQVPKRPDPKPEVSPQTKQVQAALANLRKVIDPDCLSWLESGIAGGNVNIFNQFYALLLTTVAAADFSGTLYQNQNAVSFAPEYSSPITVNTEGAFFSAAMGVGYGSSKVRSMQPGSGTAQFAILLHELGHYFQVPGFIQDDRGEGRQGANNNQILEHCSKTLFPGAQ